MFEAMGYKHAGDGILVLEGPVCPDRVTSVSLDSIVAFVECQVINITIVLIEDFSQKSYFLVKSNYINFICYTNKKKLNKNILKFVSRRRNFENKFYFPWSKFYTLIKK